MPRTYLVVDSDGLHGVASGPHDAEHWGTLNRRGTANYLVHEMHCAIHNLTKVESGSGARDRVADVREDGSENSQQRCATGETQQIVPAIHQEHKVIVSYACIIVMKWRSMPSRRGKTVGTSVGSVPLSNRATVRNEPQRKERLEPFVASIDIASASCDNCAAVTI